MRLKHHETGRKSATSLRKSDRLHAGTMLQLHGQWKRLGRYFIPKGQILNVRKVTAALHHTEVPPVGMSYPGVIPLFLKPDKASQFISKCYKFLDFSEKSFSYQTVEWFFMKSQTCYSPLRA